MSGNVQDDQAPPPDRRNSRPKSARTVSAGPTSPSTFGTAATLRWRRGSLGTSPPVPPSSTIACGRRSRSTKLGRSTSERLVAIVLIRRRKRGNFMLSEELLWSTFWRASSTGWSGPARNPPPQCYHAPLQGSVDGLLWRPPSLRRFAEPLPRKEQLTTLLQDAYGSWNDRRPVPSAGALYGLDLHVLVLGTGDLLAPRRQANRTTAWLEPVETGNNDRSLRVNAAIYHQIVGPAYVVVLSIHQRAYFQRYGLRGLRFALIECGHCVQEMLRGAALTGLSSCPLGAFDDAVMRELVATKLTDSVPAYALAIGTAPQPEDARREA